METKGEVGDLGDGKEFLIMKVDMSFHINAAYRAALFDQELDLCEK